MAEPAQPAAPKTADAKPGGDSGDSGDGGGEGQEEEEEESKFPPVPYKEPEWSGPPSTPFSLEVPCFAREQQNALCQAGSLDCAGFGRHHAHAPRGPERERERERGEAIVYRPDRLNCTRNGLTAALLHRTRTAFGRC